jgi:glycosyltransferase involved in cell wall biosynthesis
VYLFVGLCKRYKNLLELVTSFKRMPEDALLLIAGKFQEPEYFDELLRVVGTSTDRIRMMPQFIARDQLQVYLNASDAIVAPYEEVLTSGTAMLAISFGKPVIAPGKGYLNDSINSTCGVLYDAAEPDALLKAMIQARQMAFDSRTIIAHALTFDWDEIAGRTYEACLSC